MADKKYIHINPLDKIFSRLMKDVQTGILKNDKKMLDKAKAEFAEADITLYYHEEKGIIRVLQAGRPPIDFPIKK